MIEGLPVWIDILFFLAWLATIVLFHFANGKPKTLTLLIILWSVLHSVLALTGFYQNTDAVPPRFGLILIPSTIVVIYGLLPKQQQWFLSVRKTSISTFSHIVRLPVEIVLHALFIQELVPQLMTYEGRNFDILMGITAPIIGLLLVKKKIAPKGLMIWNIVGLILVLFILVNGILSAELPFQQFAFDQPNRGITYFPFVLLPATIVPIVIWTHLSDMIKLKTEMET